MPPARVRGPSGRDREVCAVRDCPLRVPGGTGGAESGVPRGAGRCTGWGVPVAPGGTGSGVRVAPGRAGGRAPGGSWQSERSRPRRSREEPDTTHSSGSRYLGHGGPGWFPHHGTLTGASCMCRKSPSLGVAGGRVTPSRASPRDPEQSGHGTGVGSSGAGRSMRAAPGTCSCEQGCAGSARTRPWGQGCAGCQPRADKPPAAHVGLAAAAPALPGSRCRQGCGQR